MNKDKIIFPTGNEFDNNKLDWIISKRQNANSGFSFFIFRICPKVRKIITKIVIIPIIE